MAQLSPGMDIPAFSKTRNIILKSEKYSLEKTVEQVRHIQGNVVLKLSGINSISDALKLIGYSMYVTCGTDEPESSLIDYRVIDMKRELWGRVVGVRDFGLNRVLEVDSGGELIYVPMDKAILRKIRDDLKIIEIDPPEGLKNLNQ